MTTAADRILSNAGAANGCRFVAYDIGEEFHAFDLLPRGLRKRLADATVKISPIGVCNLLMQGINQYGKSPRDAAAIVQLNAIPDLEQQAAFDYAGLPQLITAESFKRAFQRIGRAGPTARARRRRRGR
jgi:hypothetical protein